MFTPGNANSLLDPARDFAGHHLSCAGITESEEQVQTIARMAANAMMRKSLQA